MPPLSVRRLLAAGVALVAAFTAFTLVSTPTAGADPNINDWSRIRACEASNSYTIIDGSGTHFGAYQFDQNTWNSVGGTGRPDLNSPKEQDYRALYLYRMRGWQPWQCADSGHLNLRGDADAGARRVPIYAESAYMGGSGKPGPPASFAPPSTPPKPVPSVTPLPVTPPRATPPAVTPPPPLGFVIPPAGSGVLVEPALPLLTFSYGSCSPVIGLWQLQMNRYGYRFDGSGCFNDQTRTAVHNLQYANGIREADTIGAWTIVAAFMGRAPR